VAEAMKTFWSGSSANTLGFEEWLCGTHYSAKRMQHLRDIHGEARDTPGEAVRARIKAFVKAEMFSDFKNPRIICSRADEFKCFSGPYFKAIENVVFSHPNFIKHIPVLDRARYVVQHFGDDLGEFKILVADHTSCETHMHTTMGDIEWQVFQYINPDPIGEVIKRVLCDVQTIFCNGIVAKVLSRMSGEMNTSLGNGVGNMFATLAVVAFRYGNRWKDVRLIIEGDDSIIAVPRDMEITAEDYLRFGFVVKLDEVPTLGKAGFCSTYFLDNGEAAVVDPIKIYSHLPWSFSLRPEHGERRKQELMVAKAISLAYECPHTPVLWALSRRLLEECKDIRGHLSFDRLDWWQRQVFENVLNECGTLDMHITIKRTMEILGPPSDPTRHLFSDVFGINPEQQGVIEMFFSTCPADKIFECPDLVELVPSQLFESAALYYREFGRRP
jgi:hypothetical protein